MSGRVILGCDLSQVQSKVGKNVYGGALQVVRKSLN